MLLTGILSAMRYRMFYPPRQYSRNLLMTWPCVLAFFESIYVFASVNQY
jgi:hypothetical protein